MKIAILALGMSEKNDSVCNDVAYQYTALSRLDKNINEIRVFSGSYDPKAFPDIPVENSDAFYKWVLEDKNIVVIFHYCDSRTQYDEFLRSNCPNLIIRWHNATPPWFTLGLQNQNAAHALLGYENIVDFIDCGHAWFWTNSSFTSEQLVALGARPERCRVVYPASRYLSLPIQASAPTRDVAAKQDDGIDLLFVSRVVAHKGHANAINLASRVQELSGQPVRLHIVGKGLSEPSAFANKLRVVVQNSTAKVVVHGPTPDDKLIELYQSVDAFICMSEHEGFGLPAFEAMRYHLPVIAWATTAFRELLADHPFAFDNFDINLFASAILSLGQRNVRDRLLEIQHGILDSYSSKVIENQIANAMSAFEAPWHQPVTDDLRRVAVELRPEVARALNKQRSNLLEIFPKGYDSALTFDSHANLVSLYDLRLFGSYITQKSELIRQLTSPVDAPSIFFQPDEFSMRAGVDTLEHDGQMPAPVLVQADHLIFGPYAQMPHGQYRAIFDATVQIVSGNPVAFEIDVNSGGAQLASLDLTIATGIHRIDVPITFTLSGEAPLVELRLRATSQFTGGILFRGASLTKIDGASHNQEPSFAIIEDRSGRMPVNVLVKKAEMARNSQQWEEAARYLTLCLVDDPDNYQHLAEIANLYQKIGNIAVARSFYQCAKNADNAQPDIYHKLENLYQAHGFNQHAADIRAMVPKYKTL